MHMAGKVKRGALENALRSGIEKNPKSTMLYLALADFYMQEKRIGMQRQQFKKLSDIEPKEVRHKLTLASLYWDSGKERQASEILKNVVLADEKNEELWIMNAGFFVSKNRIADAEKIFKEGWKRTQRVSKSDLP